LQNYKKSGQHYFFLISKNMIRPQKRPRESMPILLGLNISMALAYSFCGLFIWISPSAGKILPQEYIKIVGLALLLYGCFRGYRAYLQYSTRKTR